MRAKVASKWFLLRKKVDGMLNWLLPSVWVPQYTMVAFTTMPYSKVISQRDWQNIALDRAIWGSLVTLAALGSVGAVLAADRSLRAR